MTASDSHVHLRVAPQVSARDWAGWLVLSLGAAGAGLFVLALSQVWWSFWLYAPQYPGGLRLDISLRGMSGDVHEIDLLNHYIGMSHLANAAPMERFLAGYGVAAIAVVTVVLLAVSGRKMNWLVALPALSFPVVFVADSVGWLYSFGHHLNPHAPLKIGAFTPQMFGNGKIGQFETFAQPALGFWMRYRICASCGRAATCGATCPRLLVLPEAHR
jgi:hypothetical protein